MLDNNALLIDKVSNGNSSNVDNAISNVSNVGNASKVSCVDNVSNIDHTNVSAGNVGAGCSNSGVPLFGQLMVLHQIPPPPLIGGLRHDACLRAAQVSSAGVSPGGLIGPARPSPKAGR